MKKMVMMLAALLTMSLNACSQGTKIKESKEMKKVLVAYFSASGVTKGVAAYPDVNWKEGKLLNRASKKDLEDWVKK